MKKLILYVHGKGGSIGEAEHYKPLFDGAEVVGFDYASQNPWEAAAEFPILFDRHAEGCGEVILIANSIGAYFSMCALAQKPISRAYFISPVVNMERLICDMMLWANVTEDELKECGEISTRFGEVLSWKYLCYSRKHPIKWNIPTCILYGGRDNLTSMQTISDFSKQIGAQLTVMEDGEHWFHTNEQMLFLYNWIRRSME